MPKDIYRAPAGKDTKEYFVSVLAGMEKETKKFISSGICSHPFSVSFKSLSGTVKYCAVCHILLHSSNQHGEETS